MDTQEPTGAMHYDHQLRRLDRFEYSDAVTTAECLVNQHAIRDPLFVQLALALLMLHDEHKPFATPTEPTGEIPQTLEGEEGQWIHETIRRLSVERAAGAQLNRTMQGWLLLADALRDAQLETDNWKIDHARLVEALEQMTQKHEMDVKMINWWRKELAELDVQLDDARREIRSLQSSLAVQREELDMLELFVKGLRVGEQSMIDRRRVIDHLAAWIATARAKIPSPTSRA